MDPSSSTSQLPAVSFNFASSSLSSALMESDPSFQPNSYSNAVSGEHANDDGGSENWDFGMDMDMDNDNDDPIDDFTEPANPIEQNTVAAVASIVQSPSFHLDETIPRSSEDLHTEVQENRASTSPEVQENTLANPDMEEGPPSSAAVPRSLEGPELPPPKRQRKNREYVVQVDSINGRELQRPPKLSSTLPVASE